LTPSQLSPQDWRVIKRTAPEARGAQQDATRADVGVLSFAFTHPYSLSLLGVAKCRSAEPGPAKRYFIQTLRVTETVLDLRDLRCLQPVLRAKKAVRNVPVDGVLVLECTDPLTVINVPHLVNQAGQVLKAHERRGSLCVFRIVKREG
jgi:tRNA 2-thiouridine synthesizing protein A